MTACDGCKVGSFEVDGSGQTSYDVTLVNGQILHLYQGMCASGHAPA